NHARLQFDRIRKRVQARDDGPLMQAEPQTVGKLQPERLKLTVEAELRGFRKYLRDIVTADPRSHRIDCDVHPLACLLIRVALNLGREADAEGSVVTGAITV